VASSNFIRWCGLAAILGGALNAVHGFLVLLVVYLYSPASESEIPRFSDFLATTPVPEVPEGQRWWPRSYAITKVPRDQVGFLRQQLEQECEANRENRGIIRWASPTHPRAPEPYPIV
jgi:hypothetical protein